MKAYIRDIERILSGKISGGFSELVKEEGYWRCKGDLHDVIIEEIKVREDPIDEISLDIRFYIPDGEDKRDVTYELTLYLYEPMLKTIKNLL